LHRKKDFEALKMNDEVDFLIELVKTYSPTGQTKEIAEKIYNKLYSFDVDVHTDEYGNVIAEIGNGHPRLLLCGHMDTVPGELPVELRGNILSGSGVVDAKSSLATLIFALRNVSKKQINGSIVFVAVVDEEKESLGTRHFLNNYRDFDFAIIGEPSRTYGVTIGYKGKIDLTYTLYGRPVHASASCMFDNVIEKSMDVWNSLKELLNPCIGDTSFEAITATPTLIAGGTSDNVLPESCTITADIRIPSRVNINKLLSEIRNLILSSKSKDVSPKIDNLSALPGFLTDENSELVLAFKKAISQTGHEPKLQKKGGTCDANLVAMMFDIPVVAYGPGNPRLSHTNYERLDISEYLVSINILTDAINIIFKNL